MNPLLKLARRINSSVIARNLVLAACAIIVFVFVVNLLLNLFTRHGQDPSTLNPLWLYPSSAR